jgi:hypothetical protein
MTMRGVQHRLKVYLTSILGSNGEYCSPLLELKMTLSTCSVHNLLRSQSLQVSKRVCTLLAMQSMVQKRTETKFTRNGAVPKQAR